MRTEGRGTDRNTSHPFRKEAKMAHNAEIVKIFYSPYLVENIEIRNNKIQMNIDKTTLTV